MTDTTENLEGEPKKSSKMAAILGLVLALLGGAGGFYAVYSGMILGAEPTGNHGTESDLKNPMSPLPDVAFLKVDPIIISLPPGGSSKHVRFGAQLEVVAGYQSEVESIMPRVVDVLNSYLRAVEPADFDEPAALVKLRAQMLRRVQIVTGKGRVRDLLIMEFVLT